MSEAVAQSSSLAFTAQRGCEATTCAISSGRLGSYKRDNERQILRTTKWKNTPVLSVRKVKSHAHWIGGLLSTWYNYVLLYETMNHVLARRSQAQTMGC